MDALLTKQELLTAKINQLQANFRKDGDHRKTKTYLEKKIDTLKSMYTEYVQADDQILKVTPPLEDNHPYLISRKIMEESFNKFINEMRERLHNGPPKTPTTSISSETLEPLLLPSNIQLEEKCVSQPSASSEIANKLLHEQDINMRLLYRKLDTINQESETGNWSQHFAKMKIDQINKDIELIERQHRSILINIDESEQNTKYFVDDYYGTLTQRAESTLLKLHQLISDHQDKPAAATNLRLPRLEVPIFYGEYEKWPSFKDLFLQVIHQGNLSNIEKMWYLKAHVQKAAAKLISHLASVAENYEAAWNILQTRYDNQRLLANTYFNTLVSLPTINQATASQIRNLHDTVVETLHNIQNLNLENPFEALVSHIIMKRVDSETLEKYETSLSNPREVSKLAQCMEFLTRRFQSLESSPQKPSIIRAAKPEFNIQRKVFLNTDSRFEQGTITCSYCNEQGHLLNKCHHFRNLTIKRRIDFVNRARLCTNCLVHTAKIQCPERTSCTVCNDKHHQLLHEPSRQPEKRVTISTSDSNQTTLLATAVVKSMSICGTLTSLRALIDQGSQVSLITEESVQRLGLSLQPSTVNISGIGANHTSTSTAMVQLYLQPHFPSSYRLKIDAYVLPKITMDIPERQIRRTPNKNKWNQLMLADPKYDTPAPIDLLLGADVYGDLISNQIVRGKPSAIKTSFGWVISGPTQVSSAQLIRKVHSGTKMEKDMDRFWELEEVQEHNVIHSNQNIECETIFQKTTQRDESGRYIVQLPFIEEELDKLGNSKQRALQRFLQLEKKLERNQELRKLYNEFIAEYINKGHMRQVPHFQGKYYLPHHAVLKKTPDSIKIRVVFDASMKTSTGISLNDTMRIGPSLQNNLWAILLKWRKHRIVFSADIEKMYRQIKMDKKHQPYQRILWRESKHQPLLEFQLTTVTYGTSAAPYLAIRTLHQLAEDEFSNHAEASHILKNDFYVDDVLTGAAYVDEALHLKSQLNQILAKGGMELGKWSSNHPDVLTGIAKDKVLIGDLKFMDEQEIKTLGIRYNSTGDYFLFHVDIAPNSELTKRQFLSEMSRIFDPLGWLTPLTVRCKIMYQTLWGLNLDWDDPLPKEFAEHWERMKSELRTTQLIQIPRYIHYSKDNCRLELHGFCDASEQAYAAVVYSRVVINNQVMVSLLTAKSKVAPRKTTVTIPRLELCGAVLLSRLVQQVIKALNVDIHTVTLWSDSTITLAWIRKPSSTWKSFVANRVNEIQTNTSMATWKHVRSEDNPADCASRGTTTQNLASLAKWWKGPSFLATFEPSQDETLFETSEERTTTVTSFVQLVQTDTSISELINRQSTLKRLIRITVQLLRWRTKQRGVIQSQEWDHALAALVRATQLSDLQEDHFTLAKTNTVGKHSKLQSLHPFLDDKNIIRVGGRLEHSQLPYEEQHPMILPYKGHLTKLILDWGHRETLHGGNALTLAFIRKRVWILRGNQAVKHHNHQCIRCHRFKVTTSEQLMGNLPPPRVTISRPFTHTGVDYAGPINMRMSKGRGTKAFKGYICIFICLTTKAIHIEIASDLTTEGFISAFRRMTARRGNIAHIYSDNGTNFVGAKKVLQPINWHFIPPSSPHFGGLWEAGVKSIKTHLKKCIGDTKLTFEEMTTLVTQIEACLNSRPLCPLTEDPESLDVLTPGHFLIGNALISPPQKEPLEPQRNLLERWKVVQNMRSQFWQNWVSEYLHRLQHRPKWRKETKNLAIGDLVLVRDELQPPTRWKLGRIKELHPGDDGLIRVVTLKTADNPNIKRPITKISPLPAQQSIIDEKKDEPTISLQQQQRLQPSRQAKQVRRNTICSKRGFVYTCLLLCLIGIVDSKPWRIMSNTTPNTAPVTIKDWKNSGIYFDKVAKVEFLATKWKLIIRYDLTSYWKEIESVEMGIKLLTQACQYAKPLNCNLLTQQLQWQFDNIKQDNEFLAHHDKDHRRLKRGVGDTIGLIAGDMFGILSQREAELYEEQFKQIEINEDYTRKLLKNQTTIIDNTLRLFKHNSDLTAQHLRELQQAHRSVELELTKLNQYRTHQDKSLSTILLSLQLGFVIKHIEDTQRGLLQVLTGAKNHIIHPALLPPKQLAQEISILLDQIPKNVIIPGNGQLELHNLYQLMTVKTIVTKSNAIIALEIPLVHSWDYQLYEVLAVPIINKNSQLWIHPSTKYILVDRLREHFAAVSTEELNACQDVTEYLLLCDIPTIYTRQSGHMGCEISMFLNAPLQHESCVLETTANQNYFIKLHAPNQWIFGVKQKLTIDIICDIVTYTLTLENTGLITLQPGCIFRSNELLLHTINSRTNTRDESFIPTFNISTISDEPEAITTSRANLSDITTADVTALENALEKQKGDEEFRIGAHHIHHYAVSHLILWTLIAVAIIWGIRYLHQKRATRETGAVIINSPSNNPQPLCRAPACSNEQR